MNSRGSLPVFFLAVAASCGSTWRLQLAMSTVPFSSAAMPVPEPPPDTSTDTPGATFAYSSAHAWARLTIVSEPVFWITVFSGCFDVDREHASVPPRQRRRRPGPTLTTAGGGSASTTK